MILPRGAFHSIKKGVLLSKLMPELENMHVSGLSMGSAEELNWAVVFENGACILAEFGELQGTTAWHEIISRDAIEVDAALSVFTEDQIRLSLEFNKQAVVQLSGEPVTRNEGEELNLPKPGELMQGVIATTQISAMGSEAGDVPHRNAGDLPGMSDMKYPEGESHVSPRVNDKILPETGELDPEELASKDLDSLDAKEIETMARRIRMNLKETVERLNLGYLMEERQH
jgi:hypothetical protein